MVPKDPAHRPKVETLSEMVTRWKVMTSKFLDMADEDNRTEEEKLMLVTMARQLSTCITELEQVMWKDPVRMHLARSILSVSKERRD